MLSEIVETNFNMDSAANREYARVCINWPLSNPLIFQRRFLFGPQNDIPITVRYERLLNYCFRCRSLCHDVTECEDVEQEYQMNPPGDDVENEVNSSSLEITRIDHQATLRIQPIPCSAIED